MREETLEDIIEKLVKKINNSESSSNYKRLEDKKWWAVVNSWIGITKNLESLGKVSETTIYFLLFLSKGGRRFRENTPDLLELIALMRLGAVLRYLESKGYNDANITIADETSILKIWPEEIVRRYQDLFSEISKILGLKNLKMESVRVNDNFNKKFEEYKEKLENGTLEEDKKGIISGFINAFIRSNGYKPPLELIARYLAMRETKNIPNGVMYVGITASNRRPQIILDLGLSPVHGLAVLEYINGKPYIVGMPPNTVNEIDKHTVKIGKIELNFWSKIEITIKDLIKAMHNSVIIRARDAIGIGRKVLKR